MTLRGADGATVRAAEQLAARCPVIARVLQNTGPPRWRSRPGGFQGLARIIIEQQLSVASANAILLRVKDALADLSPGAVLSAGEDEMRALGLSRPKIRYIKALAGDVTDGRFAFEELAGLADQDAAERLTRLLGVGDWTAAVYLLFCESRRDLWPRGDVALLAAHKSSGGTFDRPDIRAFDRWAEKAYAPYRGTAAHILWGQIAFLRGRAPL